jgi:hypothetical protein
MKRALVINDLHVGSYYGIMPDTVKFSDSKTGMKVSMRPNSLQKTLLGYWKEMLTYVKKAGKLDAVIVNGDIIDGCQRLSSGKFTWTNDLGVQLQACRSLLETIPCKEWFFTASSEYHAIREMPVEKILAEQMGGEFGDDLIIELNGARIHASHNIPVSKSSWQYRSTPLARDMLLMALAQSEEEYGHIDVVLRAHAHYFVQVGFAHSIGLITPGWQTRTPFGVKIDAISPPDIGFVMLEVDGRDIDVRKRIWKVPKSNCKVVKVVQVD